LFVFFVLSKNESPKKSYYFFFKWVEISDIMFHRIGYRDYNLNLTRLLP